MASNPASRFPADTAARMRERAHRARLLAARYHGEAASILNEIADDFEARATAPETTRPASAFRRRSRPAARGAGQRGAR